MSTAVRSSSQHRWVRHSPQHREVVPQTVQQGVGQLHHASAQGCRQEGRKRWSGCIKRQTVVPCCALLQTAGQAGMCLVHADLGGWGSQ